MNTEHLLQNAEVHGGLNETGYYIVGHPKGRESEVLWGYYLHRDGSWHEFCGAANFHDTRASAEALLEKCRAATAKPHPHADLMAEYAKDAAVSEKPWTKWELREAGTDDPWERAHRHPAWSVDYEYRRRPAAMTLQQLRSEIDCRIGHGVNTNGHLEYVRDRLDEMLEGGAS